MAKASVQCKVVGNTDVLPLVNEAAYPLFKSNETPPRLLLFEPQGFDGIEFRAFSTG